MPIEPQGPGDSAEDRLTVTASVGPRDCVLALTGELDHDTAPVFRTALERCDEAGSVRLLVDFSALSFCDSTGLNALLDARSKAQARGADVALVGMGPGVARLFEITGAGTLFPRFESIAEARAAG